MLTGSLCMIPNLEDINSLMTLSNHLTISLASTVSTQRGCTGGWKVLLGMGVFAFATRSPLQQIDMRGIRGFLHLCT